MVALRIADIIADTKTSVIKKFVSIISELVSTLFIIIRDVVTVLLSCFLLAMYLEGTDTVSMKLYEAYGDTEFYQSLINSQQKAEESKISECEIENCQMWANIQTETDTIMSRPLVELQCRIDQLPDEIKDDIKDLPIYMSDDIESFTVESTAFHEPINSSAYFQVLGDEQSIRIREDRLSSIYHEIGHFVDYNCTGFDNEELEELVALEGETLITEFNLFTDFYLEPREFFAESFSHYVTAPETMAKVMPVTYNFIEQVMDWYE